MPQVDLKFSANLPLDTQQIFETIEDIIATEDSSAGASKCRAYPAKIFHHQHIFLSIAVLKKPHRDQVFMENLLKKIEAAILPIIPNNTDYAIELKFASPYYLTTRKS